eukprot:SAG31_NODE_8960_length_1357_cov_1.170111_2_plen_283_part_00
MHRGKDLDLLTQSLALALNLVFDAVSPSSGTRADLSAESNQKEAQHGGRNRCDSASAERNIVRVRKIFEQHATELQALREIVSNVRAIYVMPRFVPPVASVKSSWRHAKLPHDLRKCGTAVAKPALRAQLCEREGTVVILKKRQQQVEVPGGKVWVIYVARILKPCRTSPLAFVIVRPWVINATVKLVQMLPGLNSSNEARERYTLRHSPRIGVWSTRRREAKACVVCCNRTGSDRRAQSELLVGTLPGRLPGARTTRARVCLTAAAQYDSGPTLRRPTGNT